MKKFIGSPKCQESMIEECDVKSSPTFQEIVTKKKRRYRCYKIVQAMKEKVKFAKMSRKYDRRECCHKFAKMSRYYYQRVKTS